MYLSISLYIQHGTRRVIEGEEEEVYIDEHRYSIDIRYRYRYRHTYIYRHINGRYMVMFIDV
jgi:hypothetical protein